jgi:P2 family phage contractile tail tube protein
VSKISVNRITNANLYLDGVNLLGRAAEIKLPDIEAIMSDHQALGMIGAIKLPSGFKELDGEIKWNSSYTEVSSRIANPFKPVALQCRSSVENYDSAGRVSELPLVTFLTVTFTNFPLGAFKPRDNAEWTTKFTATYVRQMQAGQEIILLDYMANLFQVNGVDQLAMFRANTGA